ncbi:glycoside hydrolase [Mucilaginibacter pedocola]|uniref:Beta-glycosidase n=1 Tax=Mucilaginibacter pedocola TaxID=1792845 RepID=A0A1S9P7X7_9SPHI|nr:glycoside hydrolase [Mucilaginibacter pedocola]OOQ56947.1 beta-glycosidase [Mucilaginibacter pedocola]
MNIRFPRYIKLALLFTGFLAFAQESFAQTKPQAALTITVDANNTAQTIENIGASGCWFSEGIGKYWPQSKKEKIAELMFSRAFDDTGAPKGIGLSAWRFNIGAGTAEQGDSSGIKDFRKRTECFLSADGKYDWSKQSGYQWFLRKAKDYGVENLIAFVNSPPVQFTQNGLGYKTVKDYRSNLKPEAYEAYAAFLVEVIKHFDGEGLHFNYISPVNEPQWDWYNKKGQASQEGSAWANAEIHHAVETLDAALQKAKLSTQILTTEAGMLNYLYGGKTATSRQIQNFFTDSSKLSFAKLKTVPRIIAGHSYFTDSGDSAMVATRRHLSDTAAKYGVKYWQSEYSMLGDGFREGTKAKRSQMDCALFLAKIINRDLTIGNATAWQLWNSYEPGSAEWDTRYYLIALKPNEQHTDGDFSITKNLWAMGNYSRFIRPGMKRLNMQRSDNMDDVKAGQQLMLSAFNGGKDKLVIVAVNYTDEAMPVNLALKNFKSIRKYRTYTTSAAPEEDLKPSSVQKISNGIVVKPRSVTTIVLN